MCNGGFITAPKHRQKGVARLMGNLFLQFAPELGYKSSFFNLVFASTEASVRLWESLGFQRVGVVPNAGRLKGFPNLVDAFQYHYDFESLMLGGISKKIGMC